MLEAIIWDYDGTIADSYSKNYLVTLDLFRNEAPYILNKNPENLKTEKAFNQALSMYDDWRDLYRECYGLSDEEINRLGSLWAKYQVKNKDLKTNIYEDIDLLINGFDVKQAVISQNGVENIQNIFKEYNIINKFSAFIGIDEVSGELSKPHYYSFLLAIEKMNLNILKGTVVYIGDHQVDTCFAHNTSTFYSSKGIPADIRSIAVSYSGSKPEEWKTKPNYIANSVSELSQILDKISKEG